MVNLFFVIVQLALTNFHSLSFHDIDGNAISMGSFQNKKVLIVNVATGSDKVDQLADLQQLQLQFSDSLKVIVFPSNSFNHESRNNAEIKQFCHENYSSSFLIAEKSPVNGAGANPIFDWLSKKSKNGEVDAPVGNDFQKFLVSKDGILIGIFSSKISPLDTELVEAINTSY